MRDRRPCAAPGPTKEKGVSSSYTTRPTARATSSTAPWRRITDHRPITGPSAMPASAPSAASQTTSTLGERPTMKILAASSPAARETAPLHASAAPATGGDAASASRASAPTIV